MSKTIGKPPVQDANLEERLGKAHIGLRHDLEVHRHVYQGQPCYVIRDPLTLQCFQLTVHEYQIFVHLTPQLSLSEILAGLCEQKLLTGDETAHYYRFVLQLHQLNFLHLPISDDKALYRRHRQRQKARRKQWLLGLFFLQIPLFNPDVFLDRTLHWVKWLFTRTFFLVYLILLTAALAVVVHRFDEVRASAATVFSLKNLPVLWLTLIGLKAVHELGHGYACKRFGGPVTDMGLFLIVLTPCAYVDVTSSWGFPSKLRRLIVGLGGIYFESLIALLALGIWCGADSPVTRAAAYNIFFLASITTILMNINPLMRFDGYYILSDLIEMPNLRATAQSHLLQFSKTVLLRIANPAARRHWTSSVLLLGFGLSASIYRILVVISISCLIARKTLFFGLLLAGAYIGMTLISLLTRLLRYLWHSPEAARYRWRTGLASLTLLLGLPGAILLIPLPGPIRAQFQLVRETEHTIRARHSGIVKLAAFAPGDSIAADTPLLILENDALREQWLTAENQLQLAQKELTAFQADPLIDPAEIARQQARLTHLTAKRDQLHTDYRQLTQLADLSGTIIQSGRPYFEGQFLQIGDPVATVVSGDWRAISYIPQRDIIDLEALPGQPVKLRVASHPNQTLTGRIVAIAPAPQITLTHLALTTLGAGIIPVDPTYHQPYEPVYQVTIALTAPPAGKLAYGATGQAILPGQTQSLGLKLYRKLLSFIASLNLQN